MQIHHLVKFRSDVIKSQWRCALLLQQAGELSQTGLVCPMRKSGSLVVRAFFTDTLPAAQKSQQQGDV